MRSTRTAKVSKLLEITQALKGDKAGPVSSLKSDIFIYQSSHLPTVIPAKTRTLDHPLIGPRMYH